MLRVGVMGAMAACLVALAASEAGAQRRRGGVTYATLHVVGSNNNRPTAANPFEEDTAEPSGFTAFKAALEEETIAFGKPVVLVHGDSHTFQIDKPVISETRPMNFTRVETFGSPDVHWVRASVDARDPEVFSFEPEILENVAP